MVGEDESATGIPAELRGREASVRLLVPIFAGVTKKGIALEPLAEGTGYSLAHLRDARHRIAWEGYMRLLTNVGTRLSDEELIAIGASYLDMPLHRAFVLPYRLLFSLHDTYRRGCQPDSPLARQILVQEMSMAYAGERRLFHDVKMKRGYTCVREYWLLRLGFLESIPRLFGLPSAKVTSFTTTPHHARFDVALPEETGLLSRLRGRASWLLAAKDAASALSAANNDLLERNTELEREVERRKQAEENLRSLNQDLERRIRARTGDLELANQELEAVNGELLMFNASIAHDLRTPLRAINGFASTVLLDYGERLGLDAAKQLERIASAAVRMGLLIDALLSLSRITQAEMSSEHVDLTAIAQEVIEELRAEEPTRVVEAVIMDGLHARGDPALARALMENVLGNAWKFTRDQPSARIELTRLDGSLPEVFCVRDNGAGFDMMHADRLFTPFTCLHGRKDYDGTGIGLAIVERIVRRHGGKIWVAAAPHDGAAFWFTLSP